MSSRKCKRKSSEMMSNDQDDDREDHRCGGGFPQKPYQYDESSQQKLLIDHAIKQNSYSALLLHSGEESSTKEAIQILAVALSCMKRIALLATMRDSGTSNSNGEVLQDEVGVMAERSARMATDELLPNMSLPLRGLEDSKYFIYNYAVTISDCQNTRVVGHPSVFTACILLNLALAHHRMGVKNGDRNSFSKAENLYSMALHLIRVVPPDTPQTTVLSIMIIAVNNLTHVHNAMGNYEKARILISQLSSLLHILKTSASPCTFFSQGDVHSFTLNSMLWCTPKAAGAA